MRDVTVTGTVSLARDMFCNNLTVSGSGHRITGTGSSFTRHAGHHQQRQRTRSMRDHQAPTVARVPRPGPVALAAQQSSCGTAGRIIIPPVSAALVALQQKVRLVQGRLAIRAGRAAPTARAVWVQWNRGRARSGVATSGAYPGLLQPIQTLSNNFHVSSQWVWRLVAVVVVVETGPAARAVVGGGAGARQSLSLAASIEVRRPQPRPSRGRQQWWRWRLNNGG